MAANPSIRLPCQSGTRTAFARMAAGILLFIAPPACSDPGAAAGEPAPTAIWMKDLVLRVEKSVVPAEIDTLIVQAIIVNAGDQTRYIEYDTCGALDIYLQRNSVGTDRPVWYSLWMRDATTGLPLACFGLERLAELHSGDSLKLSWRRFTPDEVLGDSLPEGRYYLTAAVKFHLRARRDNTGGTDAWVYLPAGSVRLDL